MARFIPIKNTRKATSGLKRRFHAGNIPVRKITTENP